MVERPTPGPLPPAHHIPHGRPPLPDGDTVPQPPPADPPPVTFAERLTAAVCVCIVLAAVAIGALR